MMATALLETSSYPGSKAGAGVWQRIISLMPAHETYFEPFGGHGAIIRRKRPAPGLNVISDVNAGVIDWWQKRKRWPASSHLTLLQEDALRILSSHPAMADPRTLVYLDPPYLRSVRTRLIYPHEFATTEQHDKLLRLIRSLRCMVMISGYDSMLYAGLIGGWRRIEYATMTRGGLRRECCWMNFRAPRTLHDCSWAGEGFRERERIKRKRDRWRNRFAGMDAVERQVIREALDAVDRPSPKPAMRSASS